MNKMRVNLYRIFIIILLILVFISSFFVCFFYNFNDNRFIKKINETINYSSQYKVYNELGENEFDTLEDINNIDVLYSYILTLENESTIKDNYKIVGNLIISDEHHELFKEELFKTDEKNYTEYGNMLNIKETENINFKEHYLEYKKVIENNNYQDVKAIIQYRLVNDIDIYNKYLDKNVNVLDDVILTIDLNNNELLKENEEITKKIYGKVNISTCYAICLELISSIVLFLLLIILLLRRIYIVKSSFSYRLNKLLNKYNNELIKVKNITSLANKEIINVSSFKELISIHKSNNTPIYYLDIKNNYEATFVIITNNLVYMFKMK